MAEVLPPVVQPSNSISLLHTSPDPFQTPSPPQSHSSSPRHPQMPRAHVYNGRDGVTGYRTSAAAPVAPYAFQSTPHLRHENRTASAPVGSVQHVDKANSGGRLGQSNASSISTNASAASSSSSRSGAGKHASKDDSALPSGTQKALATEPRSMSPFSLASQSTPELQLTLPTFSFEQKENAAPKASPNRYRRLQNRADASRESSQQDSASNATPNATPTAEKDDAFQLPRPTSVFEANARVGHSRTSSDDIGTRQGASEQAKRYRRRSLGNIDPASGSAPLTSSLSPVSTTWTPAPVSTDQSSQSLKSASFAEKRPPSSQENKPIKAKEQPQKPQQQTWAQIAAQRPSTEQRESHHSAQQIPSKPAARPASPVRVSNDKRPSSPLRTSESNSSIRPVKPSPLSKPVQQDQNDENQFDSPGIALADDNLSPPSAAAQHLQALSDKDLNKGKKSRLRRAFSFGSSAELRKASAQNTVERERAKLHKDMSEEDALDAKTAAEVAKQEAAGLGNSIYSQGQLGGSTDNLSLASTASSASMMLRKMGKGMKKSARSVKGLFRPKSVIGVPAADGPVSPSAQPSTAQVSMVTVEAERERVNVNSHPHDKPQGESGFPHLERNSMDAGSAADVVGAMVAADARSRKSIVGGDMERDEVLKAVRKGILKRTGTGSSSTNSSPVVQAVDAAVALPHIPKILDSPLPSGGNTPSADDASTSGAQKAASFHGRNDYFAGSARMMTGSTRSLPSTPQGGPRNIAFNPRIQFHDVWSSTEYDRRGDIATCNRLTPMLAQQIKEELNNFKMEMEVHELSKPHTHFF